MVSCFSAAGLTVGRVCSRTTSPEVRTFSPSELIAKDNDRVWSEKNWRSSKGRGRERLPWLNAEEATGGEEDIEVILQEH